MPDPPPDPTDMPAHPNRSDADPLADVTSPRPRRDLLLVVIIAVAVVLLIALHLTGAVGPGAH